MTPTSNVRMTAFCMTPFCMTAFCMTPFCVTPFCMTPFCVIKPHTPHTPELDTPRLDLIGIVTRDLEETTP